MAAWDVVLLDPVVVWYEGLLQADPLTAEQVAAALDLLEAYGPSLGRPLVDTLRDSRLPNLKELRPGSRGRDVDRGGDGSMTRPRDEGGSTMARTWKGLRSEVVSDGRLSEPRVAEARARQLAEVRAHRLAELREALGMTQVALAERLRVSQSRVSRIERGAIDHTQLETLRAYLEALGGELEVSARFGDERILITS